MSVITGSCQCGAIEYSVKNDIRAAGYCHCRECRKLSGSTALAFGRVSDSSLSITKGEEVISTYQKSEESVICFCRICGSNLFARKPRMRAVALYLGALNGVPSMKPRAHLFTASKAPWYEITDDLVQFETAPPEQDET